MKVAGCTDTVTEQLGSIAGEKQNASDGRQLQVQSL